MWIHPKPHHRMVWHVFILLLNMMPLALHERWLKEAVPFIVRTRLAQIPPSSNSHTLIYTPHLNISHSHTSHMMLSVWKQCSSYCSYGRQYNSWANAKAERRWQSHLVEEQGTRQNKMYIFLVDFSQCCFGSNVLNIIPVVFLRKYTTTGIVSV